MTTRSAPPHRSGLLIQDPDDAARVLADGGLLGLPTETVYGLAADAENPAAVARVFAAKGRPADHPLIVHVTGADDLDVWGRDVPDHARRLAERLWPGPLTLIVPRSPVAGDHVTGGQDSVGLRAPSHPVARAVLTAAARLGVRGVAAPSANRFGRVSPTTAAHVVDELGARLVVGTDAVLDGGPSLVGVESTILDCTGALPRLLRPGAIGAAELASAGVATSGLTATGLTANDSTTGHPARTGTADEGTTNAGTDAAPSRPPGGIRAPGTLAAHYAPSAAVHLVAAADVARTAGRLGNPLSPVGLLAEAAVETPADAVRLASPTDEATYAAVLYAALREADALGLSHVVAVPPADRGVGAAVRDRLRRAAVGSGGTLD